MRVLGIDPGSRLLGWGVIDAAGSRMVRVDSGTIRATSDAPLAERLVGIADALDAVLRAHRPEAVAVETVFFAEDSQSAIKLGQARGVALLCAARGGATVYEYTAGQVKQALTGRGRADKAQVQHMVRLVLGLGGTDRTDGTDGAGLDLGLDESDALAAAVCHAQMHATPTAQGLAAALREAAGDKRTSARGNAAAFERLLRGPKRRPPRKQGGGVT